MNYFADDFLSSASLRASFLRHMTHLKSAADGSKLYLLCSHLEHAWKIVSNIYIVSTPVIFEMNSKLKNTSNRFEVSMLKRDKPPNKQQYYKIYNSKYQNINQYNNIIEYSCQYKHNKDSISEKSSSLGLCNSCIENLKTISETKPDEMVSSATFDFLSGGYIYNMTTNKEKPSREWLNFYSKLDQKSNFSFSIPHKHASSYPRLSYTNSFPISFKSLNSTSASSIDIQTIENMLEESKSLAHSDFNIKNMSCTQNSTSASTCDSYQNINQEINNIAKNKINNIQATQAKLEGPIYNNAFDLGLSDLVSTKYSF